MIDPKLLAALREFLWMGVCWNEHNFDDQAVAMKCRALCRELGIKSVEDANELLASFDEPQMPMSDINELIEQLEASGHADQQEAAQALRLLNDENERLQDDLEHRGRIIANINDHHKRLQENHRDALLFLRSTLFSDGEAGSRLMEILSPTAAAQEKGDA